MVVDSISSPGSMATAHATVRPGGTIACLGMDHFMGSTPAINWFDQFLRNISVTGGLVPGPRYIPELLGLVEAGQARPGADAQPPPAADRGGGGLRADGRARRGRHQGGPHTGMSAEDALRAAGQDRLADALARPGRRGPGDARGRGRRARPRRWSPAWCATWWAGEAPAVHGAIAPPAPDALIALPRTDADREREARARAAGEALLREGRVAAVLLAGGQGTPPRVRRPQGPLPARPDHRVGAVRHPRRQDRRAPGPLRRRPALVRPDLAAERRRHPGRVRGRRLVRPGARLRAVRGAGDAAGGGPGHRRHPARRPRPHRPVARRPRRPALGAAGLRRPRRDVRRRGRHDLHVPGGQPAAAGRRAGVPRATTPWPAPTCRRWWSARSAPRRRWA